MKIIITITEDSFALRWTGEETREEVVDLLYLIAEDFRDGVRQAVLQESVGTLH